MPEPTKALATWAASPRDVADLVKVTQLPTLTIAEPAVRQEQRAAILSSLHDERHRLTRAKRLGKATPNELEYLADLNEYIAERERGEVRIAQQRDNEIWARLDSLAADLVALRAKAKPDK